MAPSKTSGYITAAERECISYLTGIGLRACPGCLRVRRGDIFEPDGQCFYCHDKMTPELEARISAERALVKKLRAKVARLKKKNKPCLTRRKKP